MTIKQLFNMPQLNVNNIERTCTYIKIYASIKGNRHQCPLCRKYSNKVHGHYVRTISDLAVFESKTIIVLKTRKFKCRNPQCNRKVFSEQSPYTIRYSTRTKRASKILDTLSIELTGKLGSILTEQLLIKVSSSTILRIAHNQELPEIIQPKVLGVDDWAYRKGVSYGTILIDMETSRPIDILPSREGKDLKDWLRKYHDVEIVTRDRASSYSSAINEVCPDAVQVADRFHLLMNLSDALDRYFKSSYTIIKKHIADKTNEILDLPDNEIQENTGEISSNPPSSIHQKVSEIKVGQRLDIFNKVKKLQAKGISKRKISRDLGISRGTVYSYFQQELLTPRKCSRSTNIDLFTAHIAARLKSEGFMIKDIIDEIYELGYSGGRTQAYQNINIIKEELNIYNPDFREMQKIKIPFVKPLSTRKLSKYIGFCLSAIENPDEQKYMKTLLENIPEFKIVRKLVQIFKMMMKRQKGNIKRWIEFIKNSKYKLTGLKTFANGLLRDIKAVENGINMPWSNGAVEGHVNRIKSIKRQMYGRL